MSVFFIYPSGVSETNKRLSDVGGDVTRAKQYVEANMRVDPSGPDVMVRLLPAIDEARVALEDALQTIQTFFADSCAGVDAAVKLYNDTDFESAMAQDISFPNPDERPNWPASSIPKDTDPAPKSGDDAEEWNDYVDENKVDVGN